MKVRLWQIYIYSKSKLATVVKDTLRLAFEKLLHWGINQGATPFPGVLHFALDPYLIMLSITVGGSNYHIFNLSYVSI